MNKMSLKILILLSGILYSVSCSKTLYGPSGEEGDSPVNIPYDLKINGQLNSFYVNSSDSNNLIINWSVPVPQDVDYYEIDWNMDGIPEVSYLYTTVYIHSFALGNYPVRVRLVSRDGTISKWSNVNTLLVEDNVPSSITGFSVTPLGSFFASIKWNPTTDAESGIGGYIISVGPDISNLGGIFISTDNGGNLIYDNLIVIDPVIGATDIFADNAAGWINFVQKSAGNPPFEIIVKLNNTGAQEFRIQAQDKAKNKTANILLTATITN